METPTTATAAAQGQRRIFAGSPLLLVRPVVLNQLAASLAAGKGHCLALGSFFALSIQRQATLLCSWIDVIKIE